MQEEITEESCSPETQSYCWHRCMNHTDLISPAACAAANAEEEVGCINSARELWSGDHNMDFTLGCIDVDTAPMAPFTEGEDTTATTTANEEDHSGQDDHDEGMDHSGQEDEMEASTAANSGRASFMTGAAMMAVFALFAF